MIVDPKCPIPEFIAAADLAVSRLKDFYGNIPGRISGMVFFGEHFIKDGRPYDYVRTSAFGKESDVVDCIAECLRINRQALNIITKAWITEYLNTTVNEKNDPKVREARRVLSRLLGKNEDGTDMTPEQEANAMADQILREHPERELAINLMKQQAKKYRQSGLNDMRLVIEKRMADLRLQIAQDEQLIRQTEIEAESIEANRELDAEFHRQQLAEARRVKELRLADTLDYQEIEHDYDQCLRRAKTRRAFIERMESEAAALEQQAAQKQQQYPQFNVHLAAKKRKQQLSARQRSRSSNNQHAQSATSCSTLFTT